MAKDTWADVFNLPDSDPRKLAYIKRYAGEAIAALEPPYGYILMVVEQPVEFVILARRLTSDWPSSAFLEELSR